MNNSLEILSPTKNMASLLDAMTQAIDELTKSDVVPCVAYYFEQIPFIEFARQAGRFALWEIDHDYGTAAQEGEIEERDIIHRLSNEFDIICEDDLRQYFWNYLEGRFVSFHYKKIMQASTLQDLLKNEMDIGWEGFDVVHKVASERTRLSQLRMFVDFFRSTTNWNFLRGYDISKAAAFILEADNVQMLSDSRVEFYSKRIAGELILRYKSWHEFAQSILFARVFLSLDNGIEAAKKTLKNDLPIIREMLSGVWAQSPWPRLKSNDPIIPKPIGQLKVGFSLT